MSIAPSPPRRVQLLRVLLVAAALAGCQATPIVTPASPAQASPAVTATTPTSIPATPAASLDRTSGWRTDLAMLVPGMARIHPNLTHGTSAAALDGAVAALSTTVDTATDDALMVGVLRIVAMVSAAGCDAHTGAFIWGEGSAYPVDSLPLRLWLFEDEVVVVDALEPYKGLIGSRIDTVEGHPIAEVLAAIDPIVPRDNAQTVRLLTPRFLLIPQVLRGLGLANDGPISLALTPPKGPPVAIDVQPVPMAAYNAWAGPYGLHLPVDPDVRYLSRIDDALWWERLPDTGTLYVQYNRVDRLAASLVTEFQAALREPDVARIVLDLRHNYGGELSALNEMSPVLIEAAKQTEAFFVVAGRNTFSGGSLLVARLERGTEATIVGEATGGCPTIYSDPSDLVLPWSGIAVSVAGDVAVGVDSKDPRLTIEPDVGAVLTREEWAAGRDPALEAIVAVAP
jgi:hypothetical protein